MNWIRVNVAFGRINLKVKFGQMYSLPGSGLVIG